MHIGGVCTCYWLYRTIARSFHILKGFFNIHDYFSILKDNYECCNMNYE